MKADGADKLITFTGQRSGNCDISKGKCQSRRRVTRNEG